MIRTLLNFCRILFLLLPLYSFATINANISNLDNLSIKEYNQTDTEAPTTPTNARAYQTFATSCNIQWTRSTDNIGVVSYEIYNGSDLIGTSEQYEPYFQIKGLTELTTYTFSVKAKDAAGNSSLSSSLIIVTTLDGTEPTTPNLTVSDITATSVNLSWTTSTDNVGVTGYSIYNNSFTLLAKVDGATKTFNLTGLKQATTYKLSIRATDAVGNSSLESNIETVKALDIIAPTVPINLVSSDITRTSVNLSWDESEDSEGVIGYDIYQGGNLLIATTTKTNYTITGLISNNFYSFSIKARDIAKNTSNASLPIVCETLDAIPPSTPTALKASEINGTSVNLSWNASTDNKKVTGYEIYNGFQYVATSTTTTFNVTGLTPSTIYNFSVKALDLDKNNSSESNLVTLTTLPAYCVSAGYSQVMNEYITRVKIGTIDKSSNVSSTSYSDYTTLNTELKKGEVNLITIKPNEWISGKTQFGQRYAVWIDYNGDFYFGDAGELVWNQIVTRESPVTGTFVIPENAINGKTRMRVTIRNDGVGIPSPCGDYSGSYNYGETEDYTINIINNTVDIDGPEPPTNLVAIGTSIKTTELSWTPPANKSIIIGYEIYKESLLIGSSATNTFSVTGLNPTTSYLFTVKSKNTNGKLSPSSVPVLIKTLPGEPPTEITDLMATDVTSTKVTLSWNPPKNNSSDMVYKIYRSSFLENSILTAIVNTTTYTETYLMNNSDYSFQVQAVDTEGNASPKSDNVTITTLKDIIPPTAPTNLKAENTTATSTKLSWDKATDDQHINGYFIYSGTYRVAEVSANTTSYDVKNLKEGAKYAFIVKAYDSGYNETSSDLVHITTLTLPKYCTPDGIVKYNDQISNVTFGKINNSGIQSGSYSDFNSTGAFVIPGQESTISISISKFESGTKPSGLAFWIDLNGDKDFDDEGELIYSTTITSKTFTAIYKFTIPVTVTPKRTKMRIALKENGIPTPCETFSKSKIHDYILDIKGPIIEFEAPTVPKNLVASNTTTSSTELSWTASTDNIAVTEYEIYERNKLIGTTSLTNFNITSLGEKTTYSFSVKAKDYAKNVSQMSIPISVTTQTLSIDDHGDVEKEYYILYPNPTKHNLSIKRSTNNPIFFKISTLQGQSVLEGHLNENSIDVNRLSTGIYIIELNDGEKRVTKKFIKK